MSTNRSNAMRVNSHIYWLVIFRPTSPVLVRERWQTNERKTNFSHTLYIHKKRISGCSLERAVCVCVAIFLGELLRDCDPTVSGRINLSSVNTGTTHQSGGCHCMQRGGTTHQSGGCHCMQRGGTIHISQGGVTACRGVGQHISQGVSLRADQSWFW